MSAYRKGLVFGTSLLFFVGILATCTPFLNSLNPNSSALDARPSVEVKDLAVGATKNFKTSWYHVFVTRVADQENPYKVFAIPHEDGTYLLPEFGWHRAVLPCNNFVQKTEFQCKDKYDYEQLKDPVWWSYMKWDKSGKYIGEQKYGAIIPDLYSPKFKVVGSNIVLLSN